MPQRILIDMFRVAVFVTHTLPLCAQYAAANPEWNRPIEPVRIAGNLYYYYVGASGVSAFLIATPEGHILLDTGFRETVPIIESNLKKLGFRMEDIRLILIGHAHYDHVAGVADVKMRTKARLLASPGDAPLLSSGGKGDFAFGDTYPYPPVKPDALLRDGEPVGLGGTLLTPHFTPGHTKGCTSWTMTIPEGERSYHVIIACSLSAPGYRLVGNQKYPGIIQDFESSFAKLRDLPCDIFVTGHGWDFNLMAKSQSRIKDPSGNPFVDPAGYLQFLDRTQSAFHKQVEEQKAR